MQSGVQRALFICCQEFFRHPGGRDFSCVSKLFAFGINECSEELYLMEARYKQNAVFSLFFS